MPADACPCQARARERWRDALCQRGSPLLRGRARAVAVALGAFAVALAGDALAQNAVPSLFQPSLTDPNNAQRFTKPSEGATRATQPVTATPAGAGAGETGFDSTGSIAKKRQAKRKPGSTFPLPRAGAVVLAPQRPAGQTSAQQIAVRGAYANIYKPPDSPLRRPLPPETDPFEPVGVRTGEFLLLPSVELGYGIDSNPNRTPGGQRSNFYFVTPELQAKSLWSRHELGARLRGSYTGYDSLPSANRPAADGRINGRLDATRDLRFEGEGRYLVGTDNPGNPNLQAGLARLPVFTNWGTTAGVAQRFNRLDLSVKGSIDRTEYQDSELVDGSRVSNQDRNYYQYRVQARTSYEFTPGLKPFVEIDVDKRKHDGSCTCDSIDRSSSAFTPKAGMAFELTRRLTGEISVGYTTRDYESSALETLRGWVLDSSLVWAATGLTTVKVLANSRVDETVLSGVSGILRQDVGLQIDHAFRRWLIGTVTVGYGVDNYVGSDRRDNRTSLAAIVTYKMSREFWLKGEFRQEWRRSNAPNVNYDASVFLVGMKMQR